MIFAFIETQKAELPIAFMCARLGVSRAGFYEWRARQHRPAGRTVEDRELTATIRQIHRQPRGIYGAPRVHAELVLGMGLRTAANASHG